MKTLLILSLVQVLNWTYLHFGCLGLPMPDNFEDEHRLSRYERSLHALHSRLCPAGFSSESCFYSQLTMFMRMQDSIMDPVALRNIGKRNAPTMLGMEMDTDSLTRNVLSKIGHNLKTIGTPSNYLQRAQLFDDALLQFDDTAADYSEDVHFLLKPSYLTDQRIDRYLDKPESAVDDIFEKDQGGNQLEQYLDINNGVRNTNRFANVKRTSPSFSVRKRQIICPLGMPRLDCYDNALAFYMRLMKTVEDH